MNQIEKIIDIATWNRREHYEHFSALPLRSPRLLMRCAGFGERDEKVQKSSFRILLDCEQ